MNSPEERKPSELVRHPEMLSVVTTTYYPKWYDGELKDTTDTDKIRGDLAISTLRDALKLGHHTLVVDDTGESSPFRAAINGLGVIVESQLEKGMDPARQQAFRSASQLDSVKVIAWLEPEKLGMVQPDCLWSAAEEVINGNYDLVIPARDEEGFASYPPYQAEYERRANSRFNGMLRISGLLKPEDPDLDAWFGPRIFSKDLLPSFTGKYQFTAGEGVIQKFHAHVQTGNYNSATFFPIIRALHEGKRVGSVVVPYRHPAIQTQNELDSQEMRDKRHAQYMNIITACLHYIRSLQDPETVRRPLRIKQLDN